MKRDDLVFREAGNTGDWEGERLSASRGGASRSWKTGKNHGNVLFSYVYLR